MKATSEFEAYFRDYAAAFDAFDAERIAAFFHCPCLMVSAEITVPLTSPDAILANMRALLAHHRAQGYGRATVSELRAEALADNLAIASLRWRVFDGADALLWDWRNSYNVADYGAGFRILVSTTHQSDR